MNFSLSECNALVLKAYRGAGFSWGMAQEAGHAAAWLGLHGLPALDQFAFLLDRIDGMSSSDVSPHTLAESTWHGAGGLLCPVACGVVFSECDFDQLDLDRGVTLKQLQQPLLILPFVAFASVHLGCDLTLSAGQAQINCSRQGRGVEVNRQSLITLSQQAPCNCTVEIRYSSKPIALSPTSHQRVIGSVNGLATLNRLAHRTYVPATLESMTSGAGAGLLDND